MSSFYSRKKEIANNNITSALILIDDPIIKFLINQSSGNDYNMSSPTRAINRTCRIYTSKESDTFWSTNQYFDTEIFSTSFCALVI
jgi:hypothetical protein